MPALNLGFCTWAVPLSSIPTRLEYVYTGANGSGSQVLGGPELDGQRPRENPWLPTCHSRIREVETGGFLVLTG